MRPRLDYASTTEADAGAFERWYGEPVPRLSLEDVTDYPEPAGAPRPVTYSEFTRLTRDATPAQRAHAKWWVRTPSVADPWMDEWMP